MDVFVHQPLGHVVGRLRASITAQHQLLLDVAIKVDRDLRHR